VPKPEEMAELSRIVLDYRDLGNKAVANRLDEAMREQMVSAVSEYTAGILLSGEWPPGGARRGGAAQWEVVAKCAWWPDRHRSAARAIPG